MGEDQGGREMDVGARAVGCRRPVAGPGALHGQGTGRGDGDVHCAERHEVLIVGAGGAGIAAGAALRRCGVEALLLEREATVGSSWCRRYEGLRLNTDRWMARLPGSPPPRPRWPTREQYVAYLQAERGRHRLPIRFGTTVLSLARDPAGWLLDTDRGSLVAPFLVIATGRDHEAVLPNWPGREGFEGRLLHASEYLSAGPFSGLDVLTVGAGNSATEISAYLAGAGARVRLAVRTPSNLMPDHIFGIPATIVARAVEPLPPPLLDPLGRWIVSRYGRDLSAHGLPPAPQGVGTELRRKGLGPVVDRGFAAAVRAGAIEVVAALAGFEGPEVLLADDTRLRPDVVIACTGYRYGLEGLVGGLGVLDEHGRPAVRDGERHPSAPGLFFNGYRLALSGELPEMRRNGRRIARAIAADRQRTVTLDPATARREGDGLNGKPEQVSVRDRLGARRAGR